MNISHGEVHIWRIALDFSPSTFSKLMVGLSHKEKERARCFRSSRLREQWVVSRGAIRCILGSYLQCAPGALEFRTGEYGKPELAWPSANLSFNLAHTGDMAMLAVSTMGRVGVDAEEITCDVEVGDIAQSFFASAEIHAILALPRDQRLGAFFATWTRKEAYAKALGRGLSLPFDRFVVTVSPEEPARLISADWDDASHWRLVDLAEPNVAAAVAVEEPHAVIRRLQFATPFD